MGTEEQHHSWAQQVEVIEGFWGSQRSGLGGMTRREEEGSRRKETILRWKGWALGQMPLRSQGLGVGFSRGKGVGEVRSREAEMEVGRRSCHSIWPLPGGQGAWTGPHPPPLVSLRWGRR